MAGVFRGVCAGLRGHRLPARVQRRSATQAVPDGRAATRLEGRVDDMVRAYRELGHTLAQLDPLGSARPEQPLLTLEAFGFAEADLDQVVSSRLLHGRQEPAAARVDRKTCSAFTPVQDRRGVHAHRLHEGPQLGARTHRSLARNPRARTGRPARTSSTHLLAAEAFERFLHTRYVGQKRFSLEGGEGVDAAAGNDPQPLPVAGHARKSSWAWPTADGSTCWPIS